MNKVYIFIALVIMVFITVAFLPIITDSISVINTPTELETDTAVQVLATPEVVTLTHTPDSINYVKVNGVELTVTTEYTFTDDVLTILANNSDVDDIIITSYVYTDDTVTNQVSLLNIIPIIIAVVVVAVFVKRGQ